MRLARAAGFILFFTLSFSSAKAQLPDSINAYVWECVDIMQKQSLYSGNVNWSDARDSVKQQLKTAITIKDAEATVIWVFKQLKDDHGLYGGIDTSFRYLKTGPERQFSQSILAEYQNPRGVKIQMLDNGVAYYKMPAVLIGSDKEKMKVWANLLMDSLCKIASQNPKAFIIDLRMNNGGNSEPMWHALKYLIGEKNRTYAVGADGKIIKDEEDTAALAYKKAGMPDRLCTFNGRVPVAVLIGPGTASSGEIIALSFTTRKKTRLFGEPTIGVANSTNGFVIQGKGYLLLSISYMANAKKKVLKKKYIEPDEYVKNDGDNYAEPSKDAAVLAAMRWLAKKG
jgi:carboxyl-terminal processing protease